MSFLYALKSIWKLINFIRELFLNLLFLLIILLLIGGYYLIKESRTEKVIPQQGMLVLDIEGIIVDNTFYDEQFYQLRDQLYGKQTDLSRENNLFELTQKIAQAANDPNITSMILTLDNFVGADMSSLQYIGKYLTKFSDAKKPIYAIGSHFNQSQYYLASYADKINITPQGSVSLYGLSANNLYYKTLLDNIKVNTHVFRVGTYKSAIEPFIRNDMSPEARENTTRWLSLMWQNYLSDISKQREYLPEQLVPAPETMLSLLKKFDGNMSQYAFSRGLVDKVTANYQFEDTFLQQPKVSIYDYKLVSEDVSLENNTPLIAVVFVNGAITDGSSGNDIAGSDDIVAQLKKIRQNLNVQAVVLRVNSPGGGVEASEAIRSELEALHNRDIPIVVSMGGMAASGGYWIATESDFIVASPNTITGSIGIFGIVPTFEKSLAHIGVYTDGVTTSPLAINNITQDLPNEMNQLIQISIDNGYHTFISLVAKARNMTVENVDKIAQGQVWLGQEAKQLGLVDKLGDFDDAIDMAATLANITDYRIDWQKPETSWFNGLFSNMLTILPKSTAETLFNQLPEAKMLQQQVSLLAKFTDPQNRYIYCLNCADVR